MPTLPRARALFALALPLALLPFALVPGAERVAGSAARPDAPSLDWRAMLLGPARGELEPCGCSGGQHGGIDRVAAALQFGRQESPAPMHVFAAGGVVSERAAPHFDWALAQLQTLWEAYGRMGVEAVGVGSHELMLSPDLLLGLAPLLGNGVLTSASVVDDEGQLLFEPVHRAAGVGPVLVSLARGGVAGEGWRTLSPTDALSALLAQGRLDAGPGVLLVLFEGEPSEAADFAPLLPEGAILLFHGTTGDPDHELASLPSSGHLAGKIGDRGRHLIELGALPGGSVTWRDVPVSQDVPVLPDFSIYREQYRQTLAVTDVVGQVADTLGAHPRGGYVGSEVCADCHGETHEIWMETLHSHALEALAEDLRGRTNALSDPSCVRCHAVGYGYAGGWGSAALDESLRRGTHGELAGVGCESCHGPGAAHSDSELPADIERSSAATCLGCHDGENDPDFDMAKKWPLIEH